MVRVHPELLRNQGLAPELLHEKTIWEERYRSIVDLEHHLHRNGTRVVKFFLHLSKEEQRKRFLERIDDPRKNWKLSPSDIHERQYWKDYKKAYEHCLAGTSTNDAHWYVVPADDKLNARLIVSRILLDALEDLKLQSPRVDPKQRAELLKIRDQLAKIVKGEQVTDTNAYPNWPDVEGMDQLVEQALNLRWCWNHSADWIWKTLDAELWEKTENPWIILLTVSRDKIASLLANPGFRKVLQDCLAHNQKSFAEEGWFQKKHSGAGLSLVAYFSMEFMLTEALPIYSGGLGNVAGDQLKAAGDLGVPIVAVGLLYGQGYFRQDFDADGNQQALYPVNDPSQLPMRPLREPSGEWLRIQIQLAESKIWLRCWEVSVGREKLYLLDSNDFSNTAAQRCITSELYGGNAEMRLRQEIVLGIGGWRLLRALGLQPEVCHLNEGHAAFAILERARSYMQDHKVPFELALTVTRPGNLFTTHTAVAAGFDRFDAQLLHKYLHEYAEQELGIPFQHLLEMGTQGSSDLFNMAYLAVRGSGRINGVSKLHGQVSRHIFQPLFPRWPEDEVPIGSVTNGVHVPTWDSEEADALWTAACDRNAGWEMVPMPRISVA